MVQVKHIFGESMADLEAKLNNALRGTKKEQLIDIKYMSIKSDADLKIYPNAAIIFDL
jgi:hypothetical protein